MILREFKALLLRHPVVAAGPIPTVFDPDGVYPYPSFVETSRRPVLTYHRFVTIENDRLRVTICPDLGGKVHSLIHKASGREVLFVPASVHPVRILPRFGFVPGGIEVSFPISHTPVQLETVEYQARQIGDRLYVWCGERELHFGLQWTVEFSLGECDDFLTQRTFFRNPTGRPHPWMSWSNAALPARSDTEFQFPGGRVLCHGSEVKTIDWKSSGPHSVGELDRMTGYFWLNPDRCAFGAFTPSLGTGLYHIADRASAPGIKLWSYGTGQHEIWGTAASLSGESYLEIQGGPIQDQATKEQLAPGETRSHTEFWRPASTPLDIHSLPLPAPTLIPIAQVPWFDWPVRPETNCWLRLLKAWRDDNAGEICPPPGIDTNLWAPSGMDDLGTALTWAADSTQGHERHSWLFQLGAWHAARGQVEHALEALAGCQDDRAWALLGRLQLRALREPRSAAVTFRKIQDQALARHPQVVIERDLALAALGNETLAEREHWLMQIGHTADEWVLERIAALLLDQGKPEQARARLEKGSFQLVHQRYERTELWRRIQQQQGHPALSAPAWLGEDDLAQFGAYREYEEGGGASAG